ncbi:MAG: hypothetical protein NVS9B14_03860 [Candidatus Acidiferrum sp.]
MRFDALTDFGVFRNNRDDTVRGDFEKGERGESGLRSCGALGEHCERLLVKRNQDAASGKRTDF